MQIIVKDYFHQKVSDDDSAALSSSVRSYTIRDKKILVHLLKIIIIIIHKWVSDIVVSYTHTQVHKEDRCKSFDVITYSLTYTKQPMLVLGGGDK